MEIKEIYEKINSLVPFDLCEEWDNSGLIINSGMNVTKALVTLDVTESVIEEAIEKNCELIISHHPVIFHPLRTISYTDVVYSIIQHNISVISLHTNWDKVVLEYK